MSFPWVSSMPMPVHVRYIIPRPAFYTWYGVKSLQKLTNIDKIIEEIIEIHSSPWIIIEYEEFRLGPANRTWWRGRPWSWTHFDEANADSETNGNQKPIHWSHDRHGVMLLQNWILQHQTSQWKGLKNEPGPFYTEAFAHPILPSQTDPCDSHWESYIAVLLLSVPFLSSFCPFFFPVHDSGHTSRSLMASAIRVIVLPKRYLFYGIYLHLVDKMGYTLPSVHIIEPLDSR